MLCPLHAWQMFIITVKNILLGGGKLSIEPDQNILNTNLDNARLLEYMLIKKSGLRHISCQCSLESKEVAEKTIDQFLPLHL